METDDPIWLLHQKFPEMKNQKIRVSPCENRRWSWKLMIQFDYCTRNFQKWKIKKLEFLLPLWKSKVIMETDDPRSINRIQLVAGIGRVTTDYERPPWKIELGKLTGEGGGDGPSFNNLQGLTRETGGASKRWLMRA